LFEYYPGTLEGLIAEIPEDNGDSPRTIMHVQWEVTRKTPKKRLAANMSTSHIPSPQPYICVAYTTARKQWMFRNRNQKIREKERHDQDNFFVKGWDVNEYLKKRIYIAKF
jgi:hypothetical protein